MRRLGRLWVAIVAVQRRELAAAVQRRQRGQLVRRAVVLLLAQGRVLRQSGLAVAVGVHDVRVSGSLMGEDWWREARPIGVGESLIRRGSGSE